jgi:DNA-binding XRE family transcriptional regulator
MPAKPNSTLCSTCPARPLFQAGATDIAAGKISRPVKVRRAIAFTPEDADEPLIGKPSTVAQYLKSGRQLAGEGYKRLAATLGVSMKTIRSMESGESDPSFSLMAAYCFRYGLSLDEAAKLPGKNWEPAPVETGGAS